LEKVFGKTEGLKKSELKRLSNLYRRRVPKERVLTPELAQALAALSQEVGRPLALLLDREGRVVRVGVGDAKDLPIPEGARGRGGFPASASSTPTSLPGGFPGPTFPSSS
jgi:GTP-binding protein HflX